MMRVHCVPPQLFPRGALEFYTAKNMGWDVTEAQVRRRVRVVQVACGGAKMPVCARA